jgi:hypothetical protein
MNPNNVFIEDLKKSYDETITLLDDHTKELIKDGSNLTAIIKFGEYINNIQGIYDTLKDFYSLIYNSKIILEHFKSSKQNIKQLPLTSILKNDSLHPNDLEIYKKELNKNYHKFKDEFDNFKDDEFYELFVQNLLDEAGYNKTHWFFSNTYINELEFMLDFLLYFVEENYNPVDEENIENEDINHNDRYISKAVKVLYGDGIVESVSSAGHKKN